MAELGEKGAGLIELDSLGLPVPEALIIPPTFQKAYHRRDAASRRAMIARLVESIVDFRAALDAPLPLLSFRCGYKSRRGQPKIFPDSVLNLGLDAAITGHALAAGVEETYPDDLRSVCADHADAFYRFLGAAMPAGFPSLPLPRQIELLLIPFLEAFRNRETAEPATIIVQRMVYGTLSDDSLTGMCYTRHPHTGERMDYGHFILHRQGMALGGVSSDAQLDMGVMAMYNEPAYRQLKAACALIEEHYRDIRCLEYTAERDRLFILQNTVGNRTFIIGSGRASE